MRDPWIGVGLRTQHARDVETSPGALDWYEVVTENVLAGGPPACARLERLRRDAPLALHGVSLSIAGTDPLDFEYLDAVAALARTLDAAFVSDHLCWTGVGGHTSHDLLPVTYTDEVLTHVAARVAAVQDRLGRRLFLENASAYVAFRGDAIDEAAFFAELCRRSGCGMLLDVNNLFVNAANLGIDPAAYLAAIPPGVVGYLHVAGHAVLPDVRIDTHDAAVPDPVWTLFADAARRFPDAPVILERDDAIPPFAVLVAEAEEARARRRAARRTANAPAFAAPAVRAGAVPAAASWPALQKQFFEHIVAAPREPDAAAVGLLDDARPVRPERGLRVYGDAYTTTLRTALRTNFPTLARVLRADDFAALAAAYLHAHPPGGHDFTSLGAELAAFVRGFEFAADYSAPRDALGDVAALEQAELEVQATREDAPPISAAALAALAPDAWESLRVRLSPALRVVRCSHHVLPALEAVARGEDPPPPLPATTVYLAFRGALGVRTERIDEGEAGLLDALRGGAGFADACEAAGLDAACGVRVLVAACERGIVTGLDTAPRGLGAGAGAPAGRRERRDGRSSPRR